MGDSRYIYVQGRRKGNALGWLDQLPHKIILEPCESLCQHSFSPDDASMLISFEHWSVDALVTIRNAKDADIPVLMIPDGVIEYRNTWERPAVLPGSLYQPLLAHKFAAFGLNQAMVVESWGNQGKCEIIGTPRFDGLLEYAPEKREPSKISKVLVTTANTPYFTQEQREKVLKSLVDCRRWFQQHDEEFSPVWRITSDLAEDLNLPDMSCDAGACIGLIDQLEQVDAVITTPSTVMVEAMLLQRPVAVLDYTNSPCYNPPAWSITAESQFDTVIPDMTNGNAAKMLFQKGSLHRTLECCSPALPRMLQLISEMIRIADYQRAAGRSLEFPSRIVASTPEAVDLGIRPEWFPQLYTLSKELECRSVDAGDHLLNSHLRDAYAKKKTEVAYWTKVAEEQQAFYLNVETALNERDNYEASLLCKKEKVECSIEKMYDEGIVDMVVYGVGKHTFEVLEILANSEINIRAFSDRSVQREAIFSIPVWDEERLLSELPVHILISSQLYHQQMVEHLSSLAIPKHLIHDPYVY